MLRFPGTKSLSWAAAAVLALGIAGFFLYPTQNTSTPIVLKGDVNGDGQINIVDAYLLASQLDSGQVSRDEHYDFNADGLIDQADVNELNARIVAISEDEK